MNENKNISLSNRILIIISVISLLSICYFVISNIDVMKVVVANGYDWINKQNPMVAGAISLWALGTFTFMFNNVPVKLWGWIVKQTTVSLTLNNEDRVYYEFLSWYHNTERSKKSRTLVAKNGRWDDKRGRYNINISAGYGTHYFIFGGKIFKLVLQEKDAANTKEVKESINLTTIGRSQTQFKDMMKAIVPIVDENEKTSIFKREQDYWREFSSQTPRKFESVILPKETKRTLINHLDTFFAEKIWYEKHGIPYRTGIMLYGVGGTGKTSLVRGLCEYYKKPLYILSLSGLSDNGFEDALLNIPPNNIVLIEDIDTYSVTKTRKKDKNFNNEMKEGMDFSFMTLSGMLNAIDGVIASEGRILIATTNHIEKIDKALLRKGRFNLTLNIDYMTIETIEKYFKRFYPTFIFDHNNKFKDNITPADLQSIMMDNTNDPEIIFEFCVDESTHIKMVENE